MGHQLENKTALNNGGYKKYESIIFFNNIKISDIIRKDWFNACEV
jgi:hypothetical protein